MIDPIYFSPEYEGHQPRKACNMAIDNIYFFLDEKGFLSGIFENRLIVGTNKEILEMSRKQVRDGKRPNKMDKIVSQPTDDSLRWLMEIKKEGIEDLCLIIGVERHTDHFKTMLLNVDEILSIAVTNNSVLRHLFSQIVENLQTTTDSPRRHTGGHR